MKKNRKIEIITNHKCQLGEGPVWDTERHEICWIDIVKGEIHQYTFENKNLRTFSINEMVGSFAVCKDKNFIFASKSGIGFLDRATGKIERVVNPEKDLPNNRFNDGKCDPAGRFWAGTMSVTDEPNCGNLYAFEYGTIEKKTDNISISNGMAWNEDENKMYYIDSPTFEVVAYDYEKSTGHISNREVIIKIPKEEGTPDGMTIDEDGMLWIAHWDGWQVGRWNPETGEKLFHIKLPVARVTSCTFGGKNLTDLFITSAKEGLTESQLQEQPLAGALFVVRNCGFKGVTAMEFGEQKNNSRNSIGYNNLLNMDDIYS